MILEDLEGRLFAGIPEASAILGLDRRTVRRAAAAGEIPATRVGAKWLIPISWLREQAGAGAQVRDLSLADRQRKRTS